MKVRLYNETSYKGFIKEVKDDEFVLVDGSGNTNVIKYADIDSVGGESSFGAHKLAIGVTIGVVRKK